MPDEKIIAIDASSDLMPAVYAVRHEVFVVEQAVPPELERDEFDDVAMHLAALRGDDVIGTLRIVVSGAERQDRPHGGAGGGAQSVASARG